MRKWHRWLSVFFGIFMLWIALTGLASHFAAIAAESASQGAQASAPPEGFVCPETMRCRPKGPESGPGAYVGLFHHLHSGESFGPVGTAISILSGLALIFFSISGIWLYVQMWRHRGSRGLSPRWFWD